MELGHPPVSDSRSHPDAAILNVLIVTLWGSIKSDSRHKIGNKQI
jgi:hypothetical protein